MTHLEEGILRRSVDEPLAAGEADRAHLASCSECRGRRAAIAADAAAVATLLAMPESRADAALALAHVRAALPARAIRWPVGPRFARALASLAAVLVIVFGLTSTGLADSFLRIFEPKRFVAISVTEADFRGLPDLSSFGTMEFSGPAASQWLGGGRGLDQPPLVTADAAQARAASGLPLLLPARLPARADASSLQFRVMGQARMTFTFDAARAREAAARAGGTLPAMPAGMDGSHLYVDVGPMVLQLYRLTSDGMDFPGLVIVEARPPVVSSDGLTVRALRDYLLAQPGLSSRLKAQIEAIAEPESTLPVPVPVDHVLARSVSVRGNPALLFGDATGLGSVVFWREGDVVRAVGGPITDREALDIANSLR